MQLIYFAKKQSWFNTIESIIFTDFTKNINSE